MGCRPGITLRFTGKQFKLFHQSNKMAEGVTAESVLKKISEGKLVCKICMDRFKEPKMLECSHSFCLECLQQLAETNPTSPELICPVCLGETLMTGKGVADLRADFELTSMLDEIEKHSQGSVSKCSKHTDKYVIMYCDSCKQLICTTCIAKDHRMHPAIELNEVLDNKKANEILAEVEQHHNNFKIAMEEIATSRKLLDNMFKATKEKISKKAKEEIAKEVARITEEEKKLRVELERTYKDRAKKIELAEETNNKEMTEAYINIDVVNHLMNKVNICESLHLIEKHLQDLKDYTEIQPKQVPLEFAYIDFEDDQKSFGRLRIKEEQKLKAAAVGGENKNLKLFFVICCFLLLNCLLKNIFL